jgi:hypothetical protein
MPAGGWLTEQEREGLEGPGTCLMVMQVVEVCGHDL